MTGLAISIGLLSPLGFYAQSISDRPPPHPKQQALFKGIDYQRRILTTPRPQVIHIVTIDLETPGLRPFVTPGKLYDNGDGQIKADTIAQTTSEFVETYQLQLAVNAGYFFEFSENTPWDYYPHTGDRTNVLGEYISDGKRYSEHPIKWPKLCFSSKRAVIIANPIHCPSNTSQAVSGNELLRPKSRTTPPKKFRKDKRYPRTIAALDKRGTTLWLIIADGKQPHYSEGILLSEAEYLLGELGAHIGLNLDGGGSVTLAQSTQGSPQVLNAPIHVKWPMTERPIATHLGFFAPALN